MKALGMVGRIGAALLALAFQASVAVAQPAPADALKAAETKCHDTVADALKSGQKTVRDTLLVMRNETARAPCSGPDLSSVPLPDVLDAVQKEIGDRWGDYGCRANVALPVCDGLDAAGARLLAMRGVIGADPRTAISADQSGLLRGRDAVHWRRENLSFGISPATGVSFLKLVLRSGPARGTPLEAEIGPGTDWETFQTDELTDAAGAARICDDFCASNTAHVVALFPIFRALEFAYQPAEGQIITEVAEQLESRRQRWDAYHFGGGDLRVQLPWELAVNGVIFNSQRPRDAEGKRVPFPEPPVWAVTVLHPSIGLALKDTKGADSNLVGVIEVLGFSRWTYGEDNKRENEWGLSAIAAYQPRDKDRDWGYGILARLPWRGLNIAWTRTDLKAGGNDDQLLLSIDISKYIGGGAGDISKLFQLDDPGK